MKHYLGAFVSDRTSVSTKILWVEIIYVSLAKKNAAVHWFKAWRHIGKNSVDGQHEKDTFSLSPNSKWPLQVGSELMKNAFVSPAFLQEYERQSVLLA